MLYIILSVAALTGAALSFRHQGVFHKIIALGLAGALIPAWTIPETGTLLSIGLLLLLSLLTSLYALVVRHPGIPERVAIATMSLTFMAGYIFRIQHWTHVLEIYCVLIASVLLYLFCLIRRNGVRTKEFSFMLVWTTASLYGLIRFFVPVW